jgi:hypothetical protein
MKFLKQCGLSVSISNNELELSGLSSLATDQYNRAVSYAKKHKESILRELQTEIQPMTLCLNNKNCKHFYAPGNMRPLCLLAEMPVFDLDGCPLGHWKAAAPYVMPPDIKKSERR